MIIMIIIIILMDFPIHIDTISKGLSIGYFQGVTGIIVLNLDVFLSLKVVLISANSVDPGDMKHYDAFHLGLYCFPKYMLRGFQYIKV